MHGSNRNEGCVMAQGKVPEWFRCVKCDYLNMYDQLYICERFMSADMCDDSMRGAQIIDDPTVWFCPALENNGNREDRW